MMRPCVLRQLLIGFAVYPSQVTFVATREQFYDTPRELEAQFGPVLRLAGAV